MAQFHNRPALKDRRRALRDRPTKAEAVLWQALERSRLDGRTFRRQHSVGPFVLDFYGPDRRVAIEAGWFAARPSGTEDVYKIYAESFRGPDHLAWLQAEAQEIVADAFRAAGVERGARGSQRRRVGAWQKRRGCRPYPGGPSPSLPWVASCSLPPCPSSRP